MKFHLLSIAAVVLAAVSCGSNQGSTTSYPAPVNAQEDQAIAQTIYGKVQGYQDGDVYVFKGIPYAKAERFMAPQAPDSWDGVKITRTFGPACPQGSSPKEYKQMAKANPEMAKKLANMEYAFKYTPENFDEQDLFTVNVFTQGLADGKKRPVFVWFHGGGFSSGSAINLPCYDGTSLAQKGDIVVVTVNHRLNVLGFLDMSAFGEKYQYSANAGVLDMVASLQWVHDNIEAFGGDPSQVTIAGQSGGGGKVQTLMMCPAAKDLFQRAIVQSGPYGRGHMATKEAAQNRGKAVAAELGLTAKNIEKIETIPYEELIAASNAAAAKATSGASGWTISGDGPTCDGLVLPYDFFTEESASLYADKPLLIGSTFNEMDALYYDREYTDEEAKEIIEAKYPGKSDAFIAAFKSAYPERNNNDMMSVNTGTRNGTLIVADKKCSLGNAPVYNYIFAWKSPQLNYANACCHNMDLPFMFNNIDKQRELTGSTPDAYILADKVSGAWIAFTKTGNPSHEGLPAWEPYTVDDHYTMIFDNDCVLKHNHDKEMIAVADNNGI